MCRVDYYDEEYTCFRPPASRVARKDHRCEDCGRTINKGETYTNGFWAGGLGSVKMCAHCISAGRWLVKECGGHLYPGVLEELREHQDEGYHGLAWLLTAGRMKWTRRGELIPLEEVERQVAAALAKIPVPS